MNRDENDFLNKLPDVLPEEQDPHNQGIITFLHHTSRSFRATSTEEHAQALAHIQSRLFSATPQIEQSSSSTPSLSSRKQRTFQERRHSMETTSGRKTMKSYPRLNTLVAVLSIVIIVGSFVATVQLIRANHNATTGSTTTKSGVIIGAIVHMGPYSFSQSSVTIKKGTYVQLVNDEAIPHIIENGYWIANGGQVLLVERGQPLPPGVGSPPTEVRYVSGLPKIDNYYNDKSQEETLVGPFTKQETYHIFDAIHGDMTLAIHVV